MERQQIRRGAGRWPGGSMSWHAAGATGPAVVLVHSSGMGSRQWLRLLGLGADRWRLWAPDLTGYGATTPWRVGTDPMGDDVAVISALLEQLGEPVHLVGHSYGATCAARVAMALPARVRSLALLEPVDFGLLAEVEAPEVQAEFARFTADSGDFLDETIGGTGPWMRRFVDYWNAPGFYDAMLPAQRAGLLRTGAKVFAEVRSVLIGNLLSAGLAALEVPTLVVRGAQTTASGAAMAQRVAAALPAAELHTVPGAGHMFPLRNLRAFMPVLDDWVSGGAL